MRHQFVLKLASAMALSVGLVSCGSSDVAATASSSGISTGLSAVTDRIDAVAGISDVAKMLRLKKGLQPKASFVAPSFGSLWTDSSAIQDPTVSSMATVSLQDYFGYQLDSNVTNDGGARINALGRMKNALGILCALGQAIEVSNAPVDAETGYPTGNSVNISFDATLKARMVSECGFQSSEVSGLSGAITPTLAQVTGQYDIKIDFAPTGMFNQDFYLRTNSAVVNVMSTETDSVGGLSRTIVALNRSTGVMRVEYTSVRGSISESLHGIEAHRLYYDQPNDDGLILSLSGEADAVPGSPTLNTKSRFIIGGKPEAGTGFSVSAKLRNVGSFAKYEACVNGSTGAITTDGSRCAASSVASAGDDVDSATALANVIANQAQTDWRTMSDSNTTLNWTTKSDMITANFY